MDYERLYSRYWCLAILQADNCGQAAKFYDSLIKNAKYGWISEHLKVEHKAKRVEVAALKVCRVGGVIHRLDSKCSSESMETTLSEAAAGKGGHCRKFCEDCFPPGSTPKKGK